MEQLATNVITNLPNFAAVMLMLIWQRQTINALLENQTKLLDYLLGYIEHEKPNKKPPVLDADGFE